MNILYPSNPLRLREPDAQFGAEVQAMENAGFTVSLFSYEQMLEGNFRLYNPFPQGECVLYRGWMLSGVDYERLNQEVQAVGAYLMTDPKAYIGSHHLPEWYGKLVDLTPETKVYRVDTDLEMELRALNWPEFFIKDYVKSLKTSTGSRITKPEMIPALVADMRRFRGKIEGGYCVRRVEDFLPETERRYFVVKSVPYAPDTVEVPSIVCECAKRLTGLFYSVDIVQRADGELRVVEIGDGQVSDLVGWSPERFANMLAGHFLPRK